MFGVTQNNLRFGPKRKRIHKKVVSSLKGWGFKVCSVDPCFWIKYTDLGVTLIAIYVGDCLLIGTDEGINNVIINLTDSNFGLKVNQDLTDYLSCLIHVDYKNKIAFVTQPHSIKTLEEKFGEDVNN
jgi:hypothetical protein